MFNISMSLSVIFHVKSESAIKLPKMFKVNNKD